MNKRIASLLISAVLIIIAVGALNNPAIVDACDNAVLLEKRHPGYWEYLRNGIGVDSDGDKKKDTNIYCISKIKKGVITSADYQIFLRDTDRDDKRRFVYFYDGTGIDVGKNIYGGVDTISWTIVNGENIDDWKDIRYEEKPLNEITDIYEYLTALKNYSFIISARDDAAGSWNEELSSLIENLGLKGGFKYRDSYIAIVNNGKLDVEQVSHDPLEYKSGTFYVRSAGYDTGDTDSIISISGTDYSVKGRGLNIVALENDKVIDSVAYDTSDRFLLARRK